MSYHIIVTDQWIYTRGLVPASDFSFIKALAGQHIKNPMVDARMAQKMDATLFFREARPGEVCP